MRDLKDYERTAMFDFTDDERDKISKRFEAVCSGFEALDSHDTDGVTPLVSVLNVRNIMREDIPMKLITRDELMINAPEQHEGFFVVPGTLE